MTEQSAAAAPTPSGRPPLVDRHGRLIDYLRVSLTDRCNLRCFYCLPEEGVPLKPHRDILSYEELLRVLRVAVGLGVRKIRLTGGEPLVRKGVVDFVAAVAALPGLADLAMTTNGVRLAELAGPLRRAGLRRLNISLDTLRPERFAAISRRPQGERVIEGIAAALREGFGPIKLNAVMLRGINDDEIPALAALSLDRPLHVRFIELMPLGESYAWAEERYISADEGQAILARLGTLEPLGEDGRAKGQAAGPAEYYRWTPAPDLRLRAELAAAIPPALAGIKGPPGTVGFITPVSHKFCAGCNRLRLTADGRLVPCLGFETAVDLKTPLRAGAGDEAIEAILREAVLAKPLHHLMTISSESRQRRMSRLGG